MTACYPGCTGIYTLVAIAAVSGCVGGDESASDPEDRVVEPIRLEASNVITDPRIGIPARVALTEDGLWVLDYSTNPLFHLLDPSTGDVLMSAGRRGEGPGEFEASPFSIQPDEWGRGGIWAFDAGARRLAHLTASGQLDSETRTVPMPRQLFRVAWLGADRLVAVAMARSDTAAGFVLMDSAGVEIGTAPPSFEAPEGIGVGEFRRAWVSAVSICAKPDGTRFAGAHLHFGRIALYDSEAMLIGLADVPFPSDPNFVFDEARGEYRFRSEGPVYQGCGATDDRIYAVYSGEPEGEDPQAERVGRWVHVLDWDGELRAIYELDRGVSDVAVSADGRRLYAVSILDATLTVYELPPGTP